VIGDSPTAPRRSCSAAELRPDSLNEIKTKLEELGLSLKG